MREKYWHIKEVFSLPKLFLCLCLCSMIVEGVSQEDLLYKNTQEQLDRKDVGPNTKNWWSSYLQFGFLIPIMNNDSLGVKENLSSKMFETGYRYKHKMNEHLSVGLDFGYNFSEYNILQSKTNNLLSPGVENKKQSIRMHAITFGAYARINFGKRGNIIGKYLDVGGNLQYSFRDDMLIRNEIQPGIGMPSEKIKNVYIHLPFVGDLQYFGTIRFGWNYISLFAKYRFSELFTAVDYINGNRTLPNLPPLHFGVEITQGF
jgi:hypothetical protein